MPDPLLRIDNLRVDFQAGRQLCRAVDNLSLRIAEGQALALVGESGSGKSSTALAIMQLLGPAGQIAGGRIVLQTDKGPLVLTELAERAMRRVRGRSIAMVFQEPLTALNPVMTVGAQIAESARLHTGASSGQARSQAVELLRKVQIADPQQRAGAYPHQLSGGMRQRVALALALACRPRLLIADEPTSALDVTTQAQLLDLLRLLKCQEGLSILLITHDLAVAAQLADEIGVLYAGQLVEQAEVRSLLRRPLHPYTQALLRSRPPQGGTKIARLSAIPGLAPSLLKLPAGCRFHPRCALAETACQLEEPPLKSFPKAHLTRCRLAEQLFQASTPGTSGLACS